MNELDTSIFLTGEKVWEAVDNLVYEEDLTYIEATIKFCEQNNIDLEDVKKLKLIIPKLQEKIQTEGTAAGYLKPISQLPI
jgi:hypothetical protein